MLSFSDSQFQHTLEKDSGSWRQAENDRVKEMNRMKLEMKRKDCNKNQNTRHSEISHDVQADGGELELAGKEGGMLALPRHP